MNLKYMETSKLFSVRFDLILHFLDKSVPFRFNRLPLCDYFCRYVLRVCLESDVSLGKMLAYLFNQK